MCCSMYCFVSIMCCSMDCLCVNVYYCHRLPTQLQLNIYPIISSYNIISYSDDTKFHEDLSIISCSKGQITQDDKHEQNEPTMLSRIPTLEIVRGSKCHKIKQTWNRTTWIDLHSLGNLKTLSSWNKHCLRAKRRHAKCYKHTVTTTM
jgi:hypothetical protein